MRKIVYGLLFLVFSTSIFAQPNTQTLTIRTVEGTKRIRVQNNFIVEERRYYLEHNERTIEAWQIFEVRYQIDGQWTGWDNGLETPVNYFFSNRDLESSVSLVWDYAFESTSPCGSIKTLSVSARNDFNQMFWWVGRKYLHTLRRIYIVAN